MVKRALALGGGGSKGVIQYGSLLAWKDLGFDYDFMIGSSVGALNGLLVHQGEWDKLAELWYSIDNNKVYSHPWWEFNRLLGPKASMYDSGPLLKLIKSIVNYDKLMSNPRDFYINATSYSSWESVTFNVKELSREELPLFLLASASPPIYFPRVEFRGMSLYDAGITNNYCLSQAVRYKADEIVSMNFAIPDPSPIGNAKDVLAQTLGIAMYSHYRKELGAIEKINQIIVDMNEYPPLRRIKVYSIRPERPMGIGMLDFSYSLEKKIMLRKYGYDLALECLKSKV